MANIKGELHYYPRKEESFAWQYRKLGERVEIKEEEIAEIAKAFRVAINVSIKERKDPVFLLTRLSERRLGQLIITMHETIITILGDEESEVRDCVRKLLKTYGVHDAVSKKRFGKRNHGEQMIQSVLEELDAASFGPS
jgi:hypothetical protein